MKLFLNDSTKQCFYQMYISILEDVNVVIKYNSVDHCISMVWPIHRDYLYPRQLCIFYLYCCIQIMLMLMIAVADLSPGAVDECESSLNLISVVYITIIDC